MEHSNERKSVKYYLKCKHVNCQFTLGFDLRIISDVKKDITFSQTNEESEAFLNILIQKEIKAKELNLQICIGDIVSFNFHSEGCNFVE